MREGPLLSMLPRKVRPNLSTCQSGFAREFTDSPVLSISLLRYCSQHPDLTRFCDEGAKLGSRVCKARSVEFLSKTPSRRPQWNVVEHLSPRRGAERLSPRCVSFAKTLKAFCILGIRQFVDFSEQARILKEGTSLFDH